MFVKVLLSCDLFIYAFLYTDVNRARLVLVAGEIDALCVVMSFFLIYYLLSSLTLWVLLHATANREETKGDEFQ